MGWSGCACTAVVVLLLGSVATAQVVVEGVAPHSAGGRAGVQVGDRLLSWERTRTSGSTITGRFRHPFDAREFEIEQQPRGGTRVLAERGGQRLEFRPDIGEWGVSTGLLLDGDRHRVYTRGLERARARDIDGAAAAWRPLAVDLHDAGQVGAAVWLRCRLATLLIDPVGTGADRYPMEWVHGKGVDDADALFAEAVRWARRRGDAGLEAMANEAAGRAWKLDAPPLNYPAPVSLGRARTHFARALALREKLAPGSLLVATSAHSLAIGWWAPGDPKQSPDRVKARAYNTQALVLRRRLAPGSYDEAITRYARAKGPLVWHGMFGAGPPLSLRERTTAMADLEDGFRLLQRRAPGTEVLAQAALDTTMWGGVDDEAKVFRAYRIAIPIVEELRRSPGWKATNCGPCLDLRILLTNFGGHLLRQGQIAEAQTTFERALAVALGMPEGEGNVAWIYQNLAYVASERGRQADAERYLLLALDAFTKTKREGLSFAQMLQGLGTQSSDAGNMPGAAAFLRRAIAQATAQAPPTDSDRAEVRELVCESLASLTSIREATTAEADQFDRQCAYWETETSERDPFGFRKLRLSEIALTRGQSTRAVRLARDVARRSRQRFAPGHPLRLQLGYALLQLGKARCAAGQHDAAMASLHEARQLFERLVPQSGEHIDTLAVIGRCEHSRRRPEAAVRALERALALADAVPDGRIRPHLSQAFETAKWASAYRLLTQTLVELGRPRAAFDAMERGRARAFRRVLAQRALAPVELPPSAAERRRRLWIEHQLTQQQLLAEPSPPSSEVSRLVAQLHTIGLRLESLDAERRRAQSSELAHAGLAPASLEAIAQALGGGTVLVEYSIGPGATSVFVVAPGGRPRLRVAQLGVGEAELTQKVMLFRAALERRGAGPEDRASDLGRALYDQLVAPVEPYLQHAARLVIVPDGPLHDLAFGALLRADATAGSQYLIEWKPLHVAPSGAAYAQLRTQRRAVGTTLVAAIGDPDAGRDDERSRGDGRGGRLPGSQREVRRIGQIMGPNALLLLGRDASEARVTASSARARILHFATHGVVNNSRALDSGLTLAPPPPGSTEAGDGFLQAWEIVEQLRLTADLVTLSACESAGGKALAGEGVMSLARAFHYAGARSVVSTLWRIDDEATADLMAAFYESLKAGLPKDQALQRAQVRFIKGMGSNDRRHPAYWAAFQVSGDWQ